jgi:dTDP-glucose pyrophosphorylase
MSIEWRRACVAEDATVHEIANNLDLSKLKISLVITPEDVLVGIVTDGDVRRGLLRGVNLDSPVSSIIKRKARVVPDSMDRESVMQMMKAKKILQIPIVNKDSKVVGLHVWDEFEDSITNKPNKMIIMAGGFGTRLRPHTEDCPKPMLLVHNKPILERIILKAKSEGFSEFVFATYYLSEVIEDYFGQGDKWGINIEYIKEETPLGTSGALSLMEEIPEETFIVTNGDVLTDVSYAGVLDFHCSNLSTATMAIRQHEIKNPFGVVQIDGLKIVGFEEKPVQKMNVNTGLYVLEPEALEYIEKNVFFDMPSLFEKLRLNNKSVLAYPTYEDWTDIGSYTDLEKANGKIKDKNIDSNNNDI